MDKDIIHVICIILLIISVVLLYKLILVNNTIANYIDDVIHSLSNTVNTQKQELKNTDYELRVLQEKIARLEEHFSKKRYLSYGKLFIICSHIYNYYVYTIIRRFTLRARNSIVFYYK